MWLLKVRITTAGHSPGLLELLHRKLARASPNEDALTCSTTTTSTLAQLVGDYYACHRYYSNVKEGSLRAFVSFGQIGRT